MGKKSGKKEKLHRSLEYPELGLPTIPENFILDHNYTDEINVLNEVSGETISNIRKSSLERKLKSNVDLEHPVGIENVSSKTDLGIVKSQIGTAIMGSDKEEVQSNENMIVDIVVNSTVDSGEKKIKGKKGKNQNKEKSETDANQEQSKKRKRPVKVRLENEKKENEEKMLQLETHGPPLLVSRQPEISYSQDVQHQTKLSVTATEKENKNKKIKGRKGTAERSADESKLKQLKRKRNQTAQVGDDGKEARPKKEKRSKEKVGRESKQIQVDSKDIKTETRQSIIDIKPEVKPSRVRMSKLNEVRISVTGKAKSIEYPSQRKLLEKESSGGKKKRESLKDGDRNRRRTSRDSGYSEASDRSGRRKRRLSRMSAVSSESSVESADYRASVDVRGKQKKGKKGKQKKRKPDHQKYKEEISMEKTEDITTKGETKKEAKQKSRKAARKQVKGKKRGEKGGKQAGPNYEIRKKLEELYKVAKHMGIDDTILAELENEIQGPKKKMSKKEKAKLTAELAEKAKQEMEAQAKRMEELIKMKKEEERLAAIEKDKRETIEHGMRIEQLQETDSVIQEIVDTNAKISKEEKELLEWNKYIECGKLSNPAVCAEMNTYLHLWALGLENTSIEDASNKTADAIKLLSDLDELIDTTAEEDMERLENWKWIRQLFREYQSASLDVATYRLLRNVEHNLNRINIPTADFSFKDDYVTLCLWLRVMLPIPLPNPRRPPKPRVDISFDEMNLSVLFPAVIDCESAAIRAMYLKYDHFSDLSQIFNIPEVPPDFYMDLFTITKKEWRTKLKYKFDNRDKETKSILVQDSSEEQKHGSAGNNVASSTEPQAATPQKQEEDKKIKFEEPESIESDENIPLVPFKQLDPTASDYALAVEDQLYSDTRQKLRVEVPEYVVNLRKFAILGGVFHLNLLAQPPQPQDFITMDMTITGLYLPKKLEVLPFKVVYTPYVPPEPEPSQSTTSVRKLPEELEEEMRKQEEELDKLIAVNVKWPPQVIFLELPIVCRWDDENKQWSNKEIHDVKHNEDKCMLSFRTGMFGVYGLAAYRYSNLPFQAYDIKPEADESVTVQLTAAILMLEFNIKEGLIAITQLQNSPNMTLQDAVGKYMKLHMLKRIMKEAGIDIFPAFDAFCYVDGCCEKQWAMEKHLYYNMAQISNCFNFAWSRWNLQAGRRKIVLQMRQYIPDKGKQKNHQMLLVSPLKATFIECTEVSQTFSDKEIESLKFSADLYHLTKITSGIFVRNKVSKASKQNVYTLAQFLISIRILSFS